MECPLCKKDFEEGVKAAYKLGWRDGRLIKLKNKQLRAYYLVEVMGESMSVAGHIMGGISRQAVFGLLKRFGKSCQRPKNIYKYLGSLDLTE